MRPLLLLLLTACAAEAGDVLVLTDGDREAEAVLPEGDGPAPVVVLFHGYAGAPRQNDRWLGVSEAAVPRGAIVLRPEGTRDELNLRFWNASLACCGDSDNKPDDVAHVLRLLDLLAEERAVDPTRVYAIGHSNGGFMSYRLACDAPERFAAFAPIAGSFDPDADLCTPADPPNLVHVHPEADTVIRYEGGTIDGESYLGAVDAFERWSGIAGCERPATTSPDLDLLRRDGDDTTEAVAACPDGVDARLWTLRDAGHLPSWSEGFADQLLDRMFSSTREDSGSE